MAVLVILLFSVVSACEEGLKPASLALQQNDAATALALLEPLRSQCAQSSAFYEVLGLADELSGKTSAAEEALRTAVSLGAKSTRLLTELGATYLRHDKPSEAAQVLDQALALDPANRITLKYAIGAAVGLNRWQRAAALFEKAGADKDLGGLLEEPILVVWFAQTLIETNRGNRIDSLLSSQRRRMPPGLLFSLGTLFAQHRMYALAVDYFQQVPSQDADDALYFNLGLSYSHLQRFEEARRSYFEAIDKHPGHADAYLHVGLDYAASGEPRMGVPWLFHAHMLAPARPDISYALADQLIQLGYFNTAKEVLTQACNNAPRDPLLQVADGDLKRARGDAAAAKISYRKALAEKPGLPAGLVGLARVDISAGNEIEARRLLKTALSADSQDPLVNGELGLLEFHQGDWDNAGEHLERAWTQNRSNPEIALALARLYQRKNRPQDALQLLDSMGRALQESPAFYLQRAQLYALLRRPTDAQAARDALTSLQERSRNGLHFEDPRTYVH